MTRRWRPERPDGAYSDYGSKDLMPWDEVAEKVGLSESNTRQQATNALRKIRLAMRAQALAEEKHTLDTIVQICVLEAIVPGKSDRWVRGYIKGILGIEDAN